MTLPVNEPILYDLRRLRAEVDGLLLRETPRYVTGTWTPTYFGDGTAGVFTYSTQQGIYIRIEDLVYVRGRVTISAIGTPPVGNMGIAGLPFTISATAPSGTAVFGYISNFNNAASAIQLTGLFAAGTTNLLLYESFDNGGAVQVPAANFNNASCDLIFSGVYGL